MKRFPRLKIYQIIPLALLILVVIVEVSRKPPVDWTPGYGRNEKKPYGSFVAFKLLEKTFKAHPIKVASNSPFSSLDTVDDGQIYLSISSHFNPSGSDARALFAFVERGNDLLISTNYLSGPFADSLKISTSTGLPAFFPFNPNQSTAEEHSLSFVNPAVKTKSVTIPLGYTLAKLTSEDTASSSIICVDKNDEAVMIRRRLGKGQIIFHSVPQAFSNYHLLRTTSPHFAGVTSLLRPESRMIWDDYFKPGKTAQGDVFSYIKRQAGLYPAFLLLLVLTFITILVSFKRRLPNIPEWSPPKNQSLDFAKTVGTLYFQHGDHANMFLKMRTYFLDQLRERFGQQVAANGRVDIEKLSSLSGMPVGEIKRLTGLLLAPADGTQDQLIRLDKQIHNFNTKSIR